ncbi:uroporphyrinogen-III synthase [Aquimarina sp. I32.4]|uniref:uroporphyrinogen-III synthase n=1 Tax=Aquimarina sp. I32.4 TaxID=2053903 RepID=UPI000CDE9ECA|nr:uroporphyrinogen-III synthase [Aquimarina sp. I32.4]
MNTSPTLLSTKKLSVAQKELVLNTGLRLVEYNAVTIDFLEVKGPENTISNIIFTSKNAVHAVFNQKSLPFYKIENSEIRVFCVGENTKKLLEDNGCNVVEVAYNASDLAKIIIKRYKSDSFLFFCGNMRRDELPDLLKQNNISIEEQIVYNTYLTSNIFNRLFDGILFFSPSAIRSYVSTNNIGESILFCIGNTTASEARKYTDNVVVANRPTIENVIVQAATYYRDK